MDFQQMSAISKKYVNDPLDTINQKIRESWALIPNDEYERLVFEHKREE